LKKLIQIYEGYTRCVGLFIVELLLHLGLVGEILNLESVHNNYNNNRWVTRGAHEVNHIWPRATGQMREIPHFNPKPKNNEFMDSLTYKCSSSTFLMNVEILTNTCYTIISLMKCKSINSSWFSLEKKPSHAHTLVPEPPLATLTRTPLVKKIFDIRNRSNLCQTSVCVASRGKLERSISLCLFFYFLRRKMILTFSFLRFSLTFALFCVFVCVLKCSKRNKSKMYFGPQNDKSNMLYVQVPAHKFD